MSAVLILVNILLALVAIVLIVAVLAQEGTRQGLGAITGGAETFFGKNKAKSIEGKLELITKVGAAAFIVLAIVSTMLTSSINKTNAANVVDPTVDAQVETTDGETTDGETTETADTAETTETTETETSEADETVETTESADGESTEG